VRSTSATPTTASYVTGDHGHSDQNSIAADPLDAAAVTAEDHDDERSTAPTDATSPRTPGFSMYTSSTEEHTATASEPTSESSVLHDEMPVKTVTPPHQESSPSLTTAISSSKIATPFDSPERAVISPLERSFSPVVDQTFASVTIEAESQRGWQSDWGSSDPLPPVHSPVVNTTADEEDDDDKPIGQSAKFKGMDRINSPQVSVHPMDHEPLYLLRSSWQFHPLLLGAAAIHQLLSSSFQSTILSVWVTPSGRSPCIPCIHE
jgi:sorting nexin-1/2